MESKYFESLSIEGKALLETWSFERAPALNYIFLNYEYIKNISQSDYSRIKTIQFIEKPKSYNSSMYYSIKELKLILTEEDYNGILIDLILGAIDYNQINILFPFVVNCKNLTKEQINAVISEALDNINFKKSFVAQRIMLDFVCKYKGKIQHKLFNPILVDFPHTNFLNRLI
jgi:hypothetical protein